MNERLYGYARVPVAIDADANNLETFCLGAIEKRLFREPTTADGVHPSRVTQTTNENFLSIYSWYCPRTIAKSLENLHR